MKKTKLPALLNETPSQAAARYRGYLRDSAILLAQSVDFWDCVKQSQQVKLWSDQLRGESWSDVFSFSITR